MKTVGYFDKKNQEKIVANAVSVLKTGGLAVSPTDTVYGLLVDATDETAVAKLIEFKNRPWGKPISVFLSGDAMLFDQVVVGKKQSEILKNLLPGPFTVILPSKHKVAKALESERGTLGVRIPSYELINKIVEVLGKPVTATSANLSGKKPHYNIKTLLDELPVKKKKLIDLVVDAGVLPRNKPSTVVDLLGDNLKIVRRGDITFTDSKIYISKSTSETEKIANFITEKNIGIVKTKPLVFIITGNLGAGKTVFVKGIGAYLGISNIISPTYVISYEYKTGNPSVKKLAHFDLYNIMDPEEFDHIGYEAYLKKENVLCFEWGEKSGEIIGQLKKNAHIIYVDIKYKGEKEREIKIDY